jgi:hypothetical protein
VVKNIGNQTVSLGSFSFSTYGSTNGTNKDVLKHVMFLGGGNLAKNQTINYDVSASMNYQSNQHYFVLMADHYGLIAECNENNNGGSKLVKPCSEVGDVIITGNQLGLVATNGNMTLNNVNASSNTVFTARTVEGRPNFNANAQNVNMVVGNCLNVPNTANAVSTNSSAAKSPKESFSFTENSSVESINFKLEVATILTISIWDQEAQAKLKDVAVNKSYTAGDQTLDLSGQNLINGKTYIIHFETAEGQWAKVVAW